MNFKKKVLAVTPICCLFVYLLLGFTVGKEYGSIWWWGLFIFLLVPIMPYLIGQKKIVLSVSFVITVIYLFIGFVSTFVFDRPLWHPAWIIFLLIPVFEILLNRNDKDDKDDDDEDDDTYDAK